MDKNEAVGVLKTLIDFNDSDYIKEALEMSIKSLQAPESAQTAHNPGIMQLADKLEKRAFCELKKDVGLGDHQWARGVLYAVNRLRSGQQHNA